MELFGSKVPPGRKDGKVGAVTQTEQNPFLLRM
jgi:hypothetical protein